MSKAARYPRASGVGVRRQTQLAKQACKTCKNSGREPNNQVCVFEATLTAEWKTVLGSKAGSGDTR